MRVADTLNSFPEYQKEYYVFEVVRKKYRGIRHVALRVYYSARIECDWHSRRKLIKDETNLSVCVARGNIVRGRQNHGSLSECLIRRVIFANNGR